MKLSKLLFEIKKLNSYTPPEFALVEFEPYSLALINVPIFIGHSKFNFSPSLGELKDFIASFVEVTPSNNKCLGAYQISIIAGNQDFRGAGKLIYGLASDYYKVPITSDRLHSSSLADKKTWKSIDDSGGEFKNIGELDNYMGDNKYVKYTKATDSFTDIPGPQTPNDPTDDCPLPRGAGEHDPKKITGTPYAFTYNGSIKSEPLVANWNKVLTTLRNSFDESQLKSIVDKGTTELWDDRYSGVGTDK